jgi:hypothetical protein
MFPGEKDMSTFEADGKNLEQVLNDYVRELDGIVWGDKLVALGEEIIQEGSVSLPLIQRKVNELIAKGDSRSLGHAGVLISLLTDLRYPERVMILNSFISSGIHSSDFINNVLLPIFILQAMEAAQGIEPARIARDEMISKYPQLVEKVNQRLAAKGKPLIEQKSDDPHAWLKNCNPNDKKDLSKTFWTTHKNKPHPDFLGLKEALAGLPAGDQRFVWWDLGVYLNDYFHQCYLQGLIADPHVDQLGTYLNSLLREKGARAHIIQYLHAPDEATRQRVMAYLEGQAIPQVDRKMDPQLLKDLEISFGFPGEYIP